VPKRTETGAEENHTGRKRTEPASRIAVEDFMDVTSLKHPY